MKAAEFKADSNQLAAQQALQSERQVIRFLEMDLKQSRDKTDRMEKESFTTQIKLIEFDEELVKVQQQLKLVEEERDAIKTSLKEEEVARIAAEGRIPLPISSVADEFSSPKKNRDSHIPTPKGKRLSRPALNDVFEFDIKKHADEMVYLRRQLEIETLSRKSAEDLAEFMQLSCQFKSCSCRFAEEKGVEFVYDDRVYNQELQDQYEEIQRMLKADAARRQDSAREIAIAQPTKSLIDLEDEIEFSPETGTFHTAKSPKRPTASESIQPPALKPCDDHSPNTTIVTTLAPAFEEESPSISVFSETPEILHKGSTDEYQILPVGHFEQSIERVEEQDPTTPKVIRYRESDADLLSFTPFVLPSLGSQPDQALANDVTESFVLTVNALSNSSRPVQPREQSYLTQHSSSYPPPKHTLPHHQNFNRRRSQSSQSSHSTHQTIITYTTTTTIPLAPEPKTPPSNHLPKSISKSTSAPTSLVSEVESTPGQGTDSRSGLALGYSPGTTKSREEALACIRSWRRGNAEAAGGAVTGTGPTTTTTGKEGVNARSGWSDHGGINGKPRSRSVVLVATPGQRRLGGGVGLGGGGRDRQGERERDISAPVRL